ncbi:Gfo/Idh/MocA family protein [Arthrobacter sp. ISL-65]|uniref:Gfo/Idh/MocA family protein n=1 Tax=Arthrobacter sp. ISL-65 TaxID=2819112 RepID=UPI001BE94E7B|nr:Gfo/Idh/MocA family oxidoreductase [Arthrobacter sp. ISL-65]MBT2549244.1 Gfo/Idh/MocA family oxidoreductase [Arthrobacter sp. ISL-65]
MSSQHQSGAPLGVGILGAGPVTQAIHLPSLARLTDILEVRHIMDVDPAVAESVAGRVGARFSTSVEELLADPGVDIVAICSPHQFHAAQVIASCRAGKKAVLCEKPFAMTGEEAAGISAVSAETGVPIIVGAMHTFDPGWLAAEAAWGDLPEQVHTIRSSIVLPPNPRFEDFATEIVGRVPMPEQDLSDPEVIKARLQGGVMGLAIHDLPLVRRFTPDFASVEVLHAEIAQPFGYVISLRAGAVSIELRAAMNGTWEPSWVFEAIGDDAALRIDFTPSYVHAGSAAAQIRKDGQTLFLGPYGHNGYEGEWRKLAELARGTGQPPSAETLIHDLEFALSIADAADGLVDAAGATVAEEVSA